MVAGLLLVTATVGMSGAVADLGAEADKRIASYCSPSGDVCFGVFERHRRAYLRITTAAHYFGRYTLCVRFLPPGPSADNALRCGSFPLFRGSSGTWVSSVNYARQYPVTRPGRYRVTWKSGGQALGPSLSFRLPLR